MLSGMCPNSPAPLRAPRTSCPSSAIPTPTPSDTLTNTTGPSAAVLRTAQSWARTDALTLFSTTTGRPVASCSGSRSETSPHPRVGARRTRPCSVSTRPAIETPIPRHSPTASLSASTAATASASRGTTSEASAGVGNCSSGRSGCPSRSETSTSVRLALMSMATTHRWRVSRNRYWGLRPRLVSPLAPSKICWVSSRSCTSRLIAPRRTPISRASSAREIGCRVRTRLSAIWRLISRDVPRWAIRNSVGLMRRIGVRWRLWSRMGQSWRGRFQRPCWGSSGEGSAGAHA